MAKDFHIADDILERHVRMVLSANYEDVFETSEYYNVRCIECGDSEKDVYKKRGFILKTQDPWVYYCHNCGVSTSVIKWMKDNHIVNYKNMMIEVMRNRPVGSQKTYDFTQKQSASDRDEEDDVKHFKRLTKFQDCVDYCESRKIPRKIYSKWYYATGGVFYGRIIITFRKPNGAIFYYQGRAFNNKNGVKYLSRFGEHPNRMSIYNYYSVDTSKPVPVLEGPIDSDFVENAIAVTGLKLKGNMLDKFPKPMFMLDNDDSANEKVHKLLLKKQFVFNWHKFLKQYRCKGDVKDVNDFILKNKDGITFLTWKMIEPFFTNNKREGQIYFPVKVKPKKKYK